MLSRRYKFTGPALNLFLICKVSEQKPCGLCSSYARGVPEPGARTYSEVSATEEYGSLKWEAKYNSPVKPGRLVHSRIRSQFWFNEQGLIRCQIDDFDFYWWSQMTFGALSYCCGCCSRFPRKFNSSVSERLDKLIYQNPDFPK